MTDTHNLHEQGQAPVPRRTFASDVRPRPHAATVAHPSKPSESSQRRLGPYSQQTAAPQVLKDSSLRWNDNPVEHELVSIVQHLKRMVQTAGHSWAIGDHDPLLLPMKRLTSHVKPTTPMKRWQATYFAMLLAALLAIPLSIMIRNDLRAQRYELSAATKKLVGAPVAELDKQINYDAKSKQYQYNPEAANGVKAPTNGADSGVRIGGSQYYGVDLAKVARQGQTYTDAQTKLSFSLIPQFGQLDGKHEAGHLVYPFTNGQVVYSLKANGLKEDVVVTNPTDKLSLGYKLQLPAGLEARLNQDGSVGIYSADPVLFGNISYGSDKDQQAVEKARQNGAKNNLVFLIPAPTIVQSVSDGQKALNKGSAKFELNNNMLRVVASDLSNLQYPISIDPSVIVNSANSFTNGNYEDSSMSISAGSISRGALTGGTLGTWGTAGGTAFTTSRFSLGVAAWNGYVYVSGGVTGAGTQINTVYYASISTSGTIGSWTQTTTPSETKDFRHSLVAYNGYLYILTGNQGSSQAVTTVSYINIKSDGSLGTSWTATSSLNRGRIFQSVNAYNGYLYVVGGCDSPTGAACSNNAALRGDLEYAKINADGTLGSWTASSNSALTRFSHTSVIYNGYMYVMGGCTAAGAASTNCNSTTNDAWYAPLNPSTGAPGIWTSTNVAPTSSGVRMAATAGAYNGYMYVFGGCLNAGNGSKPECNSTAPTTDAYYAPIYANGSLGTWRSTAAMSPNGLYDAGGVVYGAYHFMVGGCSDNSANCSSGAQTGSQSVPVNSVGSPGDYATSANTFTTNRFGGQTVAYKGYLYVMGGYDGTSVVNTIYAAAINTTTGDVGSFTNTNMTAFTTNREFFAAVAYDGYMYVIGGCSSAFASCTTTTNDLKTVYKAQIDADGSGDGDIGAWTAQTSITATNGRYGLSAVAYNGVMYVMGGLDGSTFQNDIQYQAFGASGVLTGTWTASGQTIPTSRAYFGAQVAAGTLYIIGGCSAGALTCTTTLNDSLHAPITSGGDLTSALVTTGNGTAFSNSRGMFGLAVSNGYLYLTGGWNGSTYYSDLQYAPLNSDGSVGTWVSGTPTLATARGGIGAAIYNGYIYAAGGYNGTTYYNNVQHAPLNNGGGGVASSWSASSATITGRFAHGTFAYNGYLYVAGGCTSWSATCSAITATTQYAAICTGANTTTAFTTNCSTSSTPGSLSSWNSGTSLNTARYMSGFATHNGYVYALGGCTAGTCTSIVSTGEYAAICTGINVTTAFSTNCTTSSTPGSLSSWNNSLSIPTAVWFASAAAWDGHMYLVGGSTATVALTSNNVQVATINGDGTLGSWSAAGTGGTLSIGSYSSGVTDVNTVANNGYLYVMGGNTFNNSANFNDVVYAAIASDGTVGSWTSTTSFPITARGTTANIANGYLYISGGYNGAYLPVLRYAPLLSTGAVGNWTVNPNYASGRYLGGNVFANGFIYLVGGADSVSTVRNDAESSPLLSLPRMAHYSRMIDMASTVNGNNGANVQFTRYLLKSTSASTGNACLSFATNSSVVFGSQVCGVPLTLSAASSFTKNVGRYAFIFVTVDDSQNAAFADSANSSISEIDAYFHAAVNRRLRGGQTFTNSGVTGGSTNNLDTEGP